MRGSVLACCVERNHYRKQTLTGLRVVAMLLLGFVAWGSFNAFNDINQERLDTIAEVDFPNPEPSPISAAQEAELAEALRHALTLLPDDQAILERVVETVFQVHSYQEPVIKVQHVLVSRSKGLDDRDNPHRWWNTTGDWKKPQAGG